MSEDFMKLSTQAKADLLTRKNNLLKALSHLENPVGLRTRVKEEQQPLSQRRKDRLVPREFLARLLQPDAVRQPEAG